MRVTLTPIGDDVVQGSLKGLAARAGDPRPALEKVVEILRAGEKRQFQSGRGWRKLSSETVRIKKAAGQNNGILRASGVLEDALTRPGAPGSLVKVRRGSLLFGISTNRSSPAFYGRFHQVGASVPRRRVVRLVKQDREAAKTVITGYLQSGRFL